MTTHADIATRFAERVTNPDLPDRSSRRSNVIADGDRIYSYGRHFIIAEVLRDARGRARLVLLNGDRFSVSTGSHQADVRAALLKHAASVPRLIIPFTALDAAQIRRDSIVPIDVKNDRVEYIRHADESMPKGATKTAALHASWGDVSGFTEIFDAFKREHGETGDANRDHWQDWHESLPDVWTLGGQEIREVDGRYVWHTTRHWLGDSLFAARSRGRSRRVKYLSSFDRQESTPLYFLCELPATAATDIDAALESLKPEPVVLAEMVGRTVTRQGDIFSIPMPGLTSADLRRQGARFGKRVTARREVDAALTAARAANDLLRELVSANDLPRAGMWAGRRDRDAAVIEHRRAKWRPILTARFAAAMERARVARESVSTLGTSHVGTEVATMPDGTQYARGIMYHAPDLMGEDRERDHKRQPMGDRKTWHLIAKNTVPVQ